MDSPNENLLSMVPPAPLAIIRKKLFAWDDEKFGVVLVETLKMISLSLWCEETFLPCSEDIDAMWHELILETRCYRELCEKVRKGKFLDHTGMTYLDYQKQIPAETLHASQLSILGSYAKNFGAFTAESVDYWVFAREIMEKTGWNLETFNSFCRSLATKGLVQHEE